MQNFKLIAHALVKLNDRYLLIKRTKIKRGKENSLPEYWDIPGGMVEEGETPSAAAIRETKEEVNLDIVIGPILHEDSNYDEYNIILQEDEHSEYRLVKDISKIDKVVDYLFDTIQHANIYNSGLKSLGLTNK